MAIQVHCKLQLPIRSILQPRISSNIISATTRSRRDVSIFTITTFFSLSNSTSYTWSKNTVSDFQELPDSGGVKGLDLGVGDGREYPENGDKVVIHYYGRLAAKQGWRFDSTYDHKYENGEPVPFEFVLGSGKVRAGIESAVRSIKVGGIHRVIIPPSQGYQSTSQEPIPPNAKAVYYHFQSNAYGQWRRLDIRNSHIRY